MTVLCSLDDLDDPGAKAFELKPPGGGQPLRIIVSRLGDTVYGWINSCPHTGVPLDQEPDRLMDLSGQFLMCSYHGAIFTLGSGVCLRGPCKGKKLMSFPVLLDDRQIKILSRFGSLE